MAIGLNRKLLQPRSGTFTLRLGVFSVLGNHDWWYDGEKVRAGFEQNGIRVLEDEVVELNWREKSFWLPDSRISGHAHNALAKRFRRRRRTRP
jgi:predicted MPP superfamily phosphohydrolase